MKDVDTLRIRELLESFSKEELTIIAGSLLVGHCDYDMEKIEAFLGLAKMMSQDKVK